MIHPTPEDLSLHLAWEFSSVLPGEFARNRANMAHRRFPILGPRPTNGSKTLPITDIRSNGYIYFVYTVDHRIRYVGKSHEKTVIQRWCRPNSLTSLCEWSHGTNAPERTATIEHIAQQISASRPVRIYYCTEDELREQVAEYGRESDQDISSILSMDSGSFMDQMERALIFEVKPEWDGTNPKKVSELFKPMATFFVNRRHVEAEA